MCVGLIALQNIVKEPESLNKVIVKRYLGRYLSSTLHNLKASLNRKFTPKCKENL